MAEIVIGLEEVINQIDGVQERAANWQPIALDLALLTQADVDQRYQSSPPVRSGGTVYGGVTWPALTEAYLAANPRREGGKIGLDTGRSRQSFTANQQGNIFKTRPQEFVFGSNLPEVRGFHTGRGNKAKARPLLFVHQGLVDSLQKRLTDWIINAK